MDEKKGGLAQVRPTTYAFTASIMVSMVWSCEVWLGYLGLRPWCNFLFKVVITVLAFALVPLAGVVFVFGPQIVD